MITGAFSYTGSAVAAAQHRRGFRLSTLTNRTRPVNPPPCNIETYPLGFGDPGQLAECLHGVEVLVNNIAWFIRRFPFFALPGDGRYRLQPITLQDTGEIIADACEAEDDAVMDAAGPRIVSFEELVRAIARAVGCKPHIVHLPGWLSLVLLKNVQGA